MEVINPFWAVYGVFNKMKNNDEQSPHILSRPDALKELVEFVQQKEPDQLSDDVHQALKKLNIILESANQLLTKFSKKNVLVHMVKASDYNSEFDNLNKSLTDAFVTLSGALHVHQEKMLGQQENMLAQQDIRLYEQEKRLAKQERKLVEQEDILLRLESNMAYESKGFYCALL